MAIVSVNYFKPKRLLNGDTVFIATPFGASTVHLDYVVVGSYAITRYLNDVVDVPVVRFKFEGAHLSEADVKLSTLTLSYLTR